MDFKHIYTLIKAIHLLKEQIPIIKCLVIREGPEKKKLEELTRKLNLEKNIIFLGFLENTDDVYATMKSSKVFVHPLTREGFGILVIEANACGIPVITIDDNGNAAKDLVKKGKNGFVCRLDEKEIAKNIMKAIKNRNRMKQACINSAKPYDWDNLMKKLEEVYLI
jgi:glycosyltransferase involved in cell wall biosynthesis